MGKHLKHTNSATYKFACENCHKSMDPSGNTQHAMGNVKNYQTAELAFRNTSGSTSSPVWKNITYDGAGTTFRYTRMDAAFGLSATLPPDVMSTVRRDDPPSSRK
jgi:hypothetical protein